MWNKQKMTPWLLALTLAASPLAWADNNQAQEAEASKATESATKANEHSESKQRQEVDTSDWLKLQEVVKHLEKEGHQEILSVAQTGRGYFARVIDKDGQRLHLLIDPTSGESKTLDAKALKKNRHAHEGQHRWHRKKGKPHHTQRDRGYYFGKKGMHAHPHHGAHQDEKEYRMQPEADAK